MRSLLVLVAVSLVLSAAIAHADVAVSAPLRLRLDHVTIQSESTATEPSITRAIATLRSELRTRLPDVERCARRVHGGFAWRWDQPGRLRMRASWTATGAIAETHTVATDFAREISSCVAAALHAITITPPPDGTVVLLLGFERDADW